MLTVAVLVTTVDRGDQSTSASREFRTKYYIFVEISLPRKGELKSAKLGIYRLL